MFSDLEQLMSEIDKFKATVTNSEELLKKLSSVNANTEALNNNSILLQQKVEETVILFAKELPDKLDSLGSGLAKSIVSEAKAIKKLLLLLISGVGISVILSLIAILTSFFK